jgi:phosphoglycolate phosphatase
MEVEYPKHLNRTAQPYPGVPSLLEELRRLPLRLAVLSNKPDEFTARCVVEFFGEGLFNPILGLSPDRPRKPDPAGALLIARRWAVPPERILYVGDSGTDMETATRAGMVPVGALWGYRDKDELIAAGARRLMESPTDLLSL